MGMNKDMKAMGRNLARVKNQKGGGKSPAPSKKK